MYSFRIFGELKKTAKSKDNVYDPQFFFVENWAKKMVFINDRQFIFEGNLLEGLNNPQVKKLLSSYEDILSLLNK